MLAKSPLPSRRPLLGRAFLYDPSPFLRAVAPNVPTETPKAHTIRATAPWHEDCLGGRRRSLAIVRNRDPEVGVRSFAPDLGRATALVSAGCGTVDCPRICYGTGAVRNARAHGHPFVGRGCPWALSCDRAWRWRERAVQAIASVDPAPPELLIPPGRTQVVPENLPKPVNHIVSAGAHRRPHNGRNARHGWRGERRPAEATISPVEPHSPSPKRCGKEHPRTTL